MLKRWNFLKTGFYEGIRPSPIQLGLRQLSSSRERWDPGAGVARKREYPLLNEAQVIAQVRTGRTDAFAEIIEHYQGPIVRYLLRLTGSHEVAEDLAQDTFMRAYQSILKTDSELSLKPESTEGGRLVSILKWPEGAPLNLG